MLIITDPNSERQWRFVLDKGETQTWLLLDECPDCTATAPITRVATLADLGAYLDAEAPGYDPRVGCPNNSTPIPPTTPAADCSPAPDTPPRRRLPTAAR